MKVKKDNKNLVWELERFNNMLPIEASENRFSTSGNEVLSTEEGVNNDMIPPSERRNNMDIGTDNQERSPLSPYQQQDKEIKAIMGPEHSTVVEETENEENIDLRIVTMYNNSKGSKNNFQVAGQNSNKESQYSKISPEELERILEENKKYKENELKYQDRINNLKDKLKQQKMKTVEANANKVKYLSNKNDLENFFLNCIEEVKKDITKRKEKLDKFPHKKLKRSTTQNLGKKRGGKAPKYEQFTKTDKKNVIEMLITNEQVLLFLYEHLFPYETQRPQSVKTLNLQKNRPTSSQPSLTTAQSFVPPCLVNNLASVRNTINDDGTTFTGHSATKMDGRFLPNQQVRAKTAQGSGRGKSGQTNRTSGANVFKFSRLPFEGKNNSTTSLLNQRVNKLPQFRNSEAFHNNDQEYSYYSINKRLLATPSDGVRPVKPQNDEFGNPNYSVQNNINNLNVNINMGDALNTKKFIPPKTSSMKKLNNAGFGRSISMKDFTRLKSSKSKKRLKKTGRNK